jgi:hypothetical protein
MKEVISLTLCSHLTRGAAFHGRPDIQIDEVFLALVDKRRHSSAIQVLQPAPDKRKPLTGKILDRWSKIQFALEPWLHLQKIYEKLQVHSKSEAVAKAFRKGLVQTGLAPLLNLFNGRGKDFS